MTQPNSNPVIAAEKPSKKDALLRFWAIQTAVCVLLAGFTYVIYRKDRTFFEEIKSGFLSLTQKDADIYAKLPFVTLLNGGETDTDTTRNGMENTTGLTASGGMEGTTGLTASGGMDLSEQDALTVLSYAVYIAEETPVYPVNNAEITSRFGKRIHPVYGTQGIHSGLDLACDEGTPVYAVSDGEVCDTGVGESSGNYVKLTHKNGLQTLYCHCSKINVAKGTKVRRGDVIAFVGHTGLATGNHLHFEVSENGIKYNPEYFLSNAVSVTTP